VQAHAHRLTIALFCSCRYQKKADEAKAAYKKEVEKVRWL
jgi:hypothetical protein